MADVNANIHIDIDATQALGQLRALQSQISSFNNSLVAGNAAAAASQRRMRDDLSAMVGATGQFNTSIRTMESGVSSLGTAFDKGTLSAKQYFRYAGSQMPGLTRAFKSLGVEQAQMADLATDRVKRLQTQYVSLGKDIQGVQKVMAIQPKNLATGMATDLAVAQQRQQLFNRALQLGSTGLVNWGKNTQWAGRQLMVGFTVPLTIAAGAAAKFFMELDKASMQFRRVYGDMNTSTEETYKNLEAVKALGVEYTKYGLAVKDVIDVGARAAATGAQNEDLMAATEQTLRLATLGQMEYGRALDATISLQTAFAISAEDLGGKIDFLNAVENQTVLTMEDMAAAIPRVAPVIKGLGGDVEDLAVFMTALREGGVTAEQGANALKSGLASLINPTARAKETLGALGVNIEEIVQANKGDLMGTVRAFGLALNSLGEFERQQSLEAVFGKYQYARLGALFKNIANDASQSARAMDLAGASMEELRGMAEKELAIVSETVTNQFLGAIERLKVAIAPIGEMFLKVVTPVINAVSAIADAFNQLPDGVKTAIGAVVAVVGGLAPIFLMGIGLIGNAIGNGIKFIFSLRSGVKNLAATLRGSGADFKYQSGAALDAAAAMSSLEGRVSGLTGDLLIQEGAVSALSGAYRDLAASAAGAAASMSRASIVPGAGGARPRSGGMIPPIRMATGGIVPGTGNKDTVPALLTPGESVITKEATAKYAPILSAMNNGTLPGFAIGQINVGGPVPFAPEYIDIERTSVRSEAAMQKALDDLFIRHLKNAGGDVSGIIGSIRSEVRQLAEAGESVSKSSLVTTLKDAGLYARMDGPLVFAHGQRQIPISPERQQQIERDFPRAAGAERMYGLGNYGFMTPEDFNRGVMTGSQAATLFNDPAIVDRTMYPMYEAIGSHLGTSAENAMRDPAIQREVRTFASNIGAELVRTTGLVTDEKFYAANERALAGTQMSPQVRSGILQSREMTTLALFGGPEENRGTKGSRVSLPGMRSYRDWDLAGLTRAPLPPAVEAAALQRGEQAARATGVGARTRSASVTTQQVGRDINSGLVLGMESTAGQVTAAGRASGLAATQGVRAAATSSLDDIERLMKQRMSMFGNEFEDGRAIGETMPIQRQISDNLSRKQMAKGREQVAWRQFSGSLGGLAAIIATGPVADIEKFASREAKKFGNQIRSGLNSMKKGLNTIGTSVLNAGVSMVAKIPNDPAAAASGAFRSSMNKVLDSTIPAAFSAMDRGASQMKKLGVLASDMGQALMYRDVKSATKMLANSIGGTAAIKPIVDSSKNFGNAIKNNWQILRSATRDVVTTFNALGAVDAARMARNIVGLDEVGRSIRNTASGVVNNVRTFGSTVGSAFKDIRTIFRSEGFRAAGQMAAQISGVTQSWNTAKTSFKTMMQDARDIALGSRALGKEMLTNARQSVSDAFRNVGASIANTSVRSFDRALGGWQGMKQSFAGIGTAFKTAGVDGANAIRASLKSAAASISSGASSVATFLKGGIDPMTGRRMGFMQKQGGAMSGIGMVGSMASMIPFMMQDEQGQFMGMNANAVGMGMMGGFGLLSVLPMLGPKVAIITAAVAAAGVAVYAWRNHVDNAARAAADFGANIGRSANILNNVADMLGQATPAQRQTQMKLSFTEEEQQQAFGQFQGMFETDAGKKFIEDLKDATAPKRFELLSDYIKTAVASGMMDTETAKLFAKTVASSLEDAVLGTAIISEINKGFTKGAQGLLELAKTRDVATQRARPMAEIQTQDGISYESASLLVGASLQNIQDFSNAAALAKEEYMNGTISFNEYIDIVNQTADAQARYSNVLNQAIAKTGDIGATAQALKDQLGLIISPEDLGRVQEAATIDTNFFKTFAAQVLPALAPVLGVPATTEEKMKLEQETMGRMAEAIFSGMNAATVAAIEQYMKQNPESRANEVFADLEGEGGFRQYQGAALAANADTMQAMGMLSEWEKGVYIDVGLNFLQSGGNLEDYQTFINTLPEEKRVKVITEFSGMTPQQQQQFITNFQAMSGLIGAENATAVREANAARAEQEALSRPDVSDVPRRKTRAASDVRTQTRENMFNERSLRAIERAQKSGVFQDLNSTITILLEEDPPNVEARLAELEEGITSLNENIPPEIQKVLGIDITNIDDVDKYAPMAEALGEIATVIESMPEGAVKEAAVNLVYESNGKPKDVFQFVKDVKQYEKGLKELDSLDLKDTKARKRVAIELMQQMTTSDGTVVGDGVIDASEAQKALDNIIKQTGLTEAQFLSLPTDTINKVLQMSVDATQFVSAAKVYEKAADALAADDPGMAQKYRNMAADLREAAAASNSNLRGETAAGRLGSSGSSGGNSGGGSGGGGAGAEDPLEAMIKDLETQKKLVGDYNKKEGEISSGFATALRRAGTPEYLIAEIIAKGEDGIKIAKKLLQDKQKKLKELMKLSIEVARATLIETQRAAAGNFKTQSSAQNLLFGAGVDPTAAMDLASDPTQAAMIVAERQKVADAEAKLAEARKKGKGVEKAQKELRAAQKDWRELTSSIKMATLAQEQFEKDSAVLSVSAMAREQRQGLIRQQAGLTRLMSQGFTFEQAQEFAGDETIALALTSTGKAADDAARRVAYLDKKLADLKKVKGKDRNKEEIQRVQAELRDARKEADRTSKAYKSLTDELKSLTKVQVKNLISNTTKEYEGLTEQLGRQLTVLGALVNAGISYEQATAIANDPTRAYTFFKALEQGGKAWEDLIAQAKAYDRALADVSIASKVFEFQEQARKNLRLPQVNQIAKQFGGQYSGIVAQTLMGLSPADLEAFFRLTEEQQKNWIDNLLASVPIAEKIKHLFDQISAQQKYQSTLNRDKANLAKGDIENLDDQLKAQRKLLKAEQDKLKAVQKTIDVIQEENDDLNRGLELLSRQEEKINEAFDKRIEALDKVEQANARIAQQQQNQLNLAQALSTGDIYAATQAAQQIKQDNATAAIENTREALELAREEQIKNLVVEVNGKLLTREQIEKRIEANNDRIYQIQEDQVEVIEAAIDAIEAQIEKVEDLKEAWQDYFDWLEDNSKITIEIDGKKIDFTFKELEDIGRRFNEIMALDEIGGDANKAFDRLIADLAKSGKALTADEQKALRQYFGIAPQTTAPTTPTTPTTPVTPTTEEEGDTTKDIAAAREAAILALPEIQKVLDAVKKIWPEINLWEDAILIFGGTIEDTIHPIMDKTKTKTGAILGKFRDLGKFLVEELIPNSLTPFKDFIEGDLLAAVNNIVAAFMNVNGQITGAIVNAGNLANTLNNLQKEIVVNIVVNTTYTSSGGPTPTAPNKPKKFMGGLIKMARGGMIPGGIPRDSVPILASPGEFVVRNTMVDKYGMSMLNDINQGSFQPRFRAPSGTSYTKINKPTEINTDRTMYNNSYNINVTANTNANADEIASATVMKIRQMNSMQIRGARG